MTRACKHLAKTRAVETTDDAYQMIGLTIIALVPALFWTGVAAAVGSAIGHPLSGAALTTIGAAIATFLFTTMAIFRPRARKD